MRCEREKIKYVQPHITHNDQHDLSNTGTAPQTNEKTHRAQVERRGKTSVRAKTHRDRILRQDAQEQQTHGSGRGTNWARHQSRNTETIRPALLVDTNCIIAALIKDSTARAIILSQKFTLHTITHAKNEVRNHKDALLNKTGRDAHTFDILLDRLLSNISILDDRHAIMFFPNARTIMDHIDPNDTPFIAAALALNCDIWSDDEHFQKQTIIKTWRTRDIVRSFTDT